jgi:hypothetical protein
MGKIFDTYTNKTHRAAWVWINQATLYANKLLRL